MNNLWTIIFISTVKKRVIIESIKKSGIETTGQAVIWNQWTGFMEAAGRCFGYLSEAYHELQKDSKNITSYALPIIRWQLQILLQFKGVLFWEHEKQV